MSISLAGVALCMNTRTHILELEKKIALDIVGQERVIRSIILCLLCDSNLLLEGMPGLAKTRAIRSLAKNVDAIFRRVQFTPDLLPADITGSEIFVPDSPTPEEAFQFREGPLFGNLILVDEINRAPAKVQSALLEAMEERQITVAGKTWALPKLFMALATQNPVEQEGTYNLPEAQLDRFLMKVQVDYPSPESEATILDVVRAEQQQRYAQAPAVQQSNVPPSRIDKEVIYQAWREVAEIYVSDSLKHYIVALIHATRYPKEHDEDLGNWLIAGGSPRATLGLERAARAHAWLEGRDFAGPADVQAVAHDVLRHRLVISFQAAAAGVRIEEAIDRLLHTVIAG